MSNIELNDILRLSDQEIAKSKIELNMQEGTGGEAYIDIWHCCNDKDKEDGTCPKCGYWGWYSTKQRNFNPGQWVFSFVRISDSEWLFTSAAKIIDVPPKTWAKVQIIDRFKPLFGRLIIRLVKGDTYARYTFNLEKYLDKCTVKEILPYLYGGEGFPGYDAVQISHKKLESILNHKKSDWISALKNQKAVYLITDINNGKLYVGSATAAEGMLLQRWSNYVADGHGGNSQLKNLVKNYGFDYVKKNFQYSILENYNAKVDDSVILRRESWWKEALKSKTFGYNDN